MNTLLLNVNSSMPFSVISVNFLSICLHLNLKNSTIIHVEGEKCKNTRINFGRRTKCHFNYFQNVTQNNILCFQVISSLKREKIKKTNIRYHASDNTGYERVSLLYKLQERRVSSNSIMLFYARHSCFYCTPLIAFLSVYGLAYERIPR